MNILYIGHYRENSSLGFLSRKYIDALNFISSVNLAIRPIYIQNENIYNGIPTHYIDLETKSYSYYDMVIQDTFPNFYEYNSLFGKNICVPKIETRNLHHTGWIDKINMMDEVWVGSFFAEKSLRESGVSKKIKVIPTPFNLDIINNNKKDKLDKEYNFYTFSSTKTKDNLLSLLIAYFAEFTSEDSVRLIIKINEPNETKIKNIITQAYHYARKNPNMVNEPLIINGYIDEQKIIDIHNNSDCYIDVSRGSYAGLCCIEAMLYGKICICTNHTSGASYVTQRNGFLIDSSETCVISESLYGISNMLTIEEKWYDSQISSIKDNMRKAYQLSTNEKEYKIQNIDSSLFDYTKFHRYL